MLACTELRIGLHPDLILSKKNRYGTPLTRLILTPRRGGPLGRCERVSKAQPAASLVKMGAFVLPEVWFGSTSHSFNPYGRSQFHS